MNTGHFAWAWMAALGQAGAWWAPSSFTLDRLRAWLIHLIAIACICMFSSLGDLSIKNHVVNRSTAAVLVSYSVLSPAFVGIRPGDVRVLVRQRQSASGCSATRTYGLLNTTRASLVGGYACPHFPSDGGGLQLRVGCAGYACCAGRYCSVLRRRQRREQLRRPAAATRGAGRAVHGPESCARALP